MAMLGVVICCRGLVIWGKGAYPFNRQLLNNDDTTSLIMLRNLSKVHGDLRARDANTDTIQNPTRNKLSKVLAGDLNSRTDEPPETCKEDRVPTSPFVRDGSSDEGADDRASG